MNTIQNINTYTHSDSSVFIKRKKREQKEKPYSPAAESVNRSMLSSWNSERIGWFLLLRLTGIATTGLHITPSSKRRAFEWTHSRKIYRRRDGTVKLCFQATQVIGEWPNEKSRREKEMAVQSVILTSRLYSLFFSFD